MHGCDRCLDRESSRPALKCLSDEGKRFADLLLIPAGSILILEEDDVTGIIQASIAPRIVQQHQSHQRRRLRWSLRSHQCLDQSTETDGFRAQISSKESVAASGHIAFVEQQIKYG